MDVWNKSDTAGADAVPNLRTRGTFHKPVSTNAYKKVGIDDFA
jgi:hypothetical protein